MDVDKTGCVVWRDLFTTDRPRSMSFYERIAGWTYITEHACDFAWGGGEKDFVLALSKEEAGAGFAETPQGLRDGWIPYIEVKDVDAAATLAERLGGAIVKQPFEVPGVGRNCLLRDPLGAYVGISLSRHGFPVPRRQFGVDCYLSAATAIPIEFYAQLFDWKVLASDDEQTGFAIAAPSGEHVAVHLVADALPDMRASWVPSINVADLDASKSDAEALGGELLNLGSEGSHEMCRAFVRDPNGAVFSLFKA